MASAPIVIAGAGIGGLAAALALARAGYEVLVLERAAELEEAGAGIQLAANATRCLAFLGVFERLRPTAVRPELFHILDGRSGESLAVAQMGAAVEARFNAPFLVIHRADLQAALLAAAREHPAIELRLGRTMEDFAVHGDAVTVLANRAGDTEEVRAGALIGADGLRSTVRERLGGRGRPVFRNRAAWRTTVSLDQLPSRYAEPAVRLWMGPGTHLVAYPIRAGTALNLVAVTTDRRPTHGWGTGAAPEEIAAAFARWHREPRALIGAPEHWLRWALFDLDMPGPWGTGPVTLLGDAAHAMLPFLAQGAAQALEDACVLGLTLAEAQGEAIPAALRVYEKRRTGRVARVQAAARAADRIYHMGEPGRSARNLVLRCRSEASVLERYAWIYQWGP